jgi:hypothetical protein
VPHVRLSVRGPKMIRFDCFWLIDSQKAMVGFAKRTKTLSPEARSDILPERALLHVGEKPQTLLRRLHANVGRRPASRPRFSTRQRSQVAKPRNIGTEGHGLGTT